MPIAIDDIPHAEPQPLKSDLKVAFIADTGLNSYTKMLWKKLVDQGHDMIIHPGDFAYRFRKGRQFVKTVSSIIPQEIPYITTTGDHDLFEFSKYQEGFVERDLKTPGLSCEGSWGTASVCTYEGIVVLSAGLAFREFDFDLFLHQQLKKYEKWPWKICSWHRNAEHLQVGSKSDGISPRFYEICRKYGAVIITGHQHTYSRTHPMKSFADPSIDDKLKNNYFYDDSDPNHAFIYPGQSVVIVTGLAGTSARPWIERNMKNRFWASVVAKQNMITGGALSCTFNPGGVDEGLSFCQYEDLEGVLHDQFTLRSVSRPIMENTIQSQPLKTESLAKETASFYKESPLWSMTTGVVHSIRGRELNRKLDMAKMASSSPHGLSCNKRSIFRKMYRNLRSAFHNFCHPSDHRHITELVGNSQIVRINEPVESYKIWRGEGPQFLNGHKFDVKLPNFSSHIRNILEKKDIVSNLVQILSIRLQITGSDLSSEFSQTTLSSRLRRKSFGSKTSFNSFLSSQIRDDTHFYIRYKIFLEEPGAEMVASSYSLRRIKSLPCTGPLTKNFPIYKNHNCFDNFETLNNLDKSHQENSAFKKAEWTLPLKALTQADTRAVWTSPNLLGIFPSYSHINEILLEQGKYVSFIPDSEKSSALIFNSLTNPHCRISARWIVSYKIT